MTDPVIPNPMKTSDLQSFGRKPPTASATPHGAAGGHKSSIEIIRASARNEMPPGSDVEKMVRQLAGLIQKKVVQLLQLGDTVFLLYPQKDGTVEFHTFTTESPQNLVARYKAGLNSLRQMGYKKAVSYANSPAFVKIAEQTGIPVKTTQTMKQVGNKMQPMYKFEVDV
jgi:hypothetical protein